MMPDIEKLIVALNEREVVDESVEPSLQDFTGSSVPALSFRNRFEGPIVNGFRGLNDFKYINDAVTPTLMSYATIDAARNSRGRKVFQTLPGNGYYLQTGF